MPRKPTPIKERFMQRFVKDEKTKCWNWISTKDYNGYGKISEGAANSPDRKQWLAHRLSYTLFRGAIPEGMFIDHLCRNPSCVNPNHLEVVTNKENLHRGNNHQLTHCKKGHELVDGNILYEKYPWGLGRRCKLCRDANRKERDAKNRDSLNAYQREYRQRNLEKMREYDRSRKRA